MQSSMKSNYFITLTPFNLHFFYYFMFENISKLNTLNRTHYSHPLHSVSKCHLCRPHTVKFHVVWSKSFWSCVKGRHHHQNHYKYSSGFCWTACTRLLSPPPQKSPGTQTCLGTGGRTVQRDAWWLSLVQAEVGSGTTPPLVPRARFLNRSHTGNCEKWEDSNLQHGNLMDASTLKKCHLQISILTTQINMNVYIPYSKELHSITTLSVMILQNKHLLDYFVFTWGKNSDWQNGMIVKSNNNSNRVQTAQ